MTDKRIQKLTELVKVRYDNDDPSHDFNHITRVIKWCQKIGEKKDANLFILVSAALLHDLVNVPKNHPNRINASEMAAKEAQDVLGTLDYSEDEIAQIVKIIIEHSYSRGENPSSVESAILQDCDRLDAIGAIGLMRMVTCGSKMGSKYYDYKDPFATHRPLNDKEYSLDHLFTKLFKLADKMNTKEAKEEALKRSDFMRTFVSQFQKEIT